MTNVSYGLIDELQKRQIAIEEKFEPQQFDKGGGPPHDGGMEARVAKLESAVEYIQRDIAEVKADLKDIKKDARTDFRVLFGAVIAVALGLAGLMAKGFHWL